MLQTLRLEYLPRVAQEGQVIFTAARAFHLPGQAQEGVGLPDAVEGDVGEGDVFL